MEITKQQTLTSTSQEEQAIESVSDEASAQQVVVETSIAGKTEQIEVVQVVESNKTEEAISEATPAVLETTDLDKTEETIPEAKADQDKTDLTVEDVAPEAPATADKIETEKVGIRQTFPP